MAQNPASTGAERGFLPRLAAHFGRKLPSARYIPELDGLRCLTVALVVLFHTHHLFLDGSESLQAEAALAQNGIHLPNFFIAKGWFGVQIFFVLSGLVAALPYASHFLRGSPKPHLQTYFRRRLLRIAAPYLIVLTFLFLYSGLITGGQSFLNEWDHYGAGLILAHTLFYNGALNPILPVSWTLEIEIQFFLLAPFLCQFLSIPQPWLRRSALLSLIFFSPKLAIFLNELHPSPFWGHSLIGQLCYFSSGLLLADLYTSFWRDSPPRHGLHWDAIGICIWPFAFVLTEWWTAWEWKPLVLMIGFIAILRGHFLRTLLSHPALTTIGALCYTIFLTHMWLLGLLNHFVIQPLFRVVPGQWPLNYLPMMTLLLLTFALCSLLFLVIEKPFNRPARSRPAPDEPPVQPPRNAASA